MTPAQRLKKLQQIHIDKRDEIMRVTSSPQVPARQKQLIYACLNNLCQLSANLHGELSQAPVDYDLLEQSAELDAALLELRTLVGAQIPHRTGQAA